MFKMHRGDVHHTKQSKNPSDEIKGPEGFWCVRGRKVSDQMVPNASTAPAAISVSQPAG